MSDAGPTAASRLDDLAAASPILTAALSELRAGRITNALAEAVTQARVSDEHLSEFLSLAARQLPADALFGLALSLPEYIDRRHAGHDALDYCLTHPALADRRVALAARLPGVSNPPAVQWCHSRLTTVIREDSVYHSFLERHIDVVVDRCFEEMLVYLLQPPRGPGQYLAYCFNLVMARLDDPGPLVQAWYHWVVDGSFDGEDSDDNRREAPSVLYALLSGWSADPSFADLQEVNRQRVDGLMRSTSPADRTVGMAHLVAMAATGYPHLKSLLSQLSDRVEPRAGDEGGALKAVFEATRAALNAQDAPDDADRQERARDAVNDAQDSLRALRSSRTVQAD